MNFQYIPAHGNSLPLWGTINYKLTNIDAQTYAAADISGVVVGGTDGDTINNVRAQPRTIVLDLQILHEVEATKRLILTAFKIKQEGTLQWTQNDRTLEIKGIVESIDMPRWSEAVMMQITLHCSDPFWSDTLTVAADINEIVDLHYFTTFVNDMLVFPDAGIPFGEIDTTRTRIISNSGDVEVGLDIEIIALDTVTNPILYSSTGKFFGCGYGTGAKKVQMSAGDIIKISTGKNQKKVSMNGVSLYGKIKPNSTWLQLPTGDTSFSVNSDEESIQNMTFILTYKNRYV